MQSKIINVLNPETGKHISLVFSNQAVEDVTAYARDASKLMNEGMFKELDNLLIKAKESGDLDDVREDLKEIMDCPYYMEDKKGVRYSVVMVM